MKKRGTLNHPTLATLALAAALLMAAPEAHAEVHVVNQINLTFVPDEITVAPGDTIQWVWSGGSHTVTSGTPCTPDGVFFDEPLNAGSPVFEYVVPGDFEGEIPYFCRPHCGIGMRGNIVVDGGPCPEDLDGSGAIDFGDILVILGAWGPCPPKGECPEDLDDSGTVDFADVLILLGIWGPCE